MIKIVLSVLTFTFVSQFAFAGGGAGPMRGKHYRKIANQHSVVIVGKVDDVDTRFGKTYAKVYSRASVSIDNGDIASFQAGNTVGVGYSRLWLCAWAGPPKVQSIVIWL